MYRIQIAHLNQLIRHKIRSQFLIHEVYDTEVVRKLLKPYFLLCRHYRIVCILCTSCVYFFFKFSFFPSFFLVLFSLAFLFMSLMVQELNNFGGCCGPIRLHIIRLFTSLNLITTITVIFVVSISHVILLVRINVFELVSNFFR